MDEFDRVIKIIGPPPIRDNERIVSTMQRRPQQKPGWEILLVWLGCLIFCAAAWYGFIRLVLFILDRIAS